MFNRHYKETVYFTHTHTHKTVNGSQRRNKRKHDAYKIKTLFWTSQQKEVIVKLKNLNVDFFNKKVHSNLEFELYENDICIINIVTLF